ncbi:beta-3-deoxy-D-manno-oct-2-ulosonic acid transferase, partial [Acidithiobacillus ferridurans]|nr:beta-3-deoxy-D-manno-oct-2-ulosonic acid transferase [Acidithiobacillus ferridurans]
LEAVDAVHVLTSSTGFEALLRAKPVTCHGVPFYSGWGLTDDRISVARRSRRRSLDELVAAVLILYPRYLHPLTKTLCKPEEAIAGLGALRRRARDHRTTLWRKGFRMVLRHVVGVR